MPDIITEQREFKCSGYIFSPKTSQAMEKKEKT